MSDYWIHSVKSSDEKSLSSVRDILKSQGLKLDNGLDCIAVAENADSEIVATGSALGNTLRCFAVKEENKGDGILNLLVTYLMQIQAQRGNDDVFLYTKPSSVLFFQSIGFYEIARVDNKLVFMENKRNNFKNYLSGLSKFKQSGKKAGCIVMNANPFTLGHRYLIEQALKNCDVLHLFLVSEDLSEVSFSIRKKLVLAGISDLKNIIVHDSGSYIISNSTFPSYFLENDDEVMKVHASLDACVFVKIASAMDIKVRFFGTEPFSKVTSIYNDVMKVKLEENSIEFKLVERLEKNGRAVSATDVRKAVKDGNFEKLKDLLPKTTLDFFESEEALPVVESIKSKL